MRQSRNPTTLFLFERNTAKRISRNKWAHLVDDWAVARVYDALARATYLTAQCCLRALRDV